MTDHDTAVNQLFGEAPTERVLKGDAKRKPEAVEHIIEFPGGAIEIARTADGDYWAHIIVHRGQVIRGSKGRVSALGDVVSSRIDWDERRVESIPGLPDEAHLRQIAVLIRPAQPTTTEVEK